MMAETLIAFSRLEWWQACLLILFALPTLTVMVVGAAWGLGQFTVVRRVSIDQQHNYYKTEDRDAPTP